VGSIGGGTRNGPSNTGSLVPCSAMSPRAPAQTAARSWEDRGRGRNRNRMREGSVAGGWPANDKSAPAAASISGSRGRGRASNGELGGTRVVAGDWESVQENIVEWGGHLLHECRRGRRFSGSGGAWIPAALEGRGRVGQRPTRSSCSRGTSRVTLVDL
jgi:hypothetical protein